MKRRFSAKHFIPFVLILLFLSVSAAGSDGPDEPIKSGRIQSRAGSFSFRIFTSGVEIRDRRDRIVFQARDRAPDAVALACGHSESFGFYGFFQREAPDATGKRLVMVSTNYPEIAAIKATADFYSPVLVSDPGDVVVTVTEGFRLVAWELHSGRKIWEKTFPAPVVHPRRVVTDRGEILRFLFFSRGRYREHHFFTGPGFPPRRIFGPEDDEGNPRDLPAEPEIPASHSILSFGDSITYGYVNKTPTPELGYVPRLQALLDAEYNGVTVLNRGVPGETTVRAMNRYATVLNQDRSSYLLFHEGTNDFVIRPDIPVDTTLFNIRTMMEIALDLEMLPVLSTIIPRDPNHSSGSGIFRLRAEAIREGIRIIAADLTLPLIDFWDIFSLYPGGSGGYASLMSDYVHPSEKGYALMAENWRRALLDIPPQAPVDLKVISSSPWNATIGWQPNPEFDLAEYLVYHGSSREQLDFLAVSNTPGINLLRPPFQAGLQRERWIQVFARDREGNTGQGSDVIRIEFPVAAPFRAQTSGQKQIPRVKRMPLNREDMEAGSR